MSSGGYTSRAHFAHVNVMGYWYQDSISSLGHTASYTYDPLNRLATAVATGSSTYNLTFSYDRYGNMACVTNGQTNGPCPNFTFNTNNQITTSGYQYDAAGNLTMTTNPTHTYQWGAENRLQSIDGGTRTGLRTGTAGGLAVRG